MAFDFESFCEECCGLSKTEVIRKIDEEIAILKALISNKRKSLGISQRDDSLKNDKTAVKTLERMASYIAGKSLLRVKFTANELKLVDKILERMR